LTRYSFGATAAPQPQPHNPVEFMPVKAHVYRAIAELNGRFEKVIQDLQTPGRISLFRSLSYRFDGLPAKVPIFVVA
jgi:hypothetical protein